MKYIISFFSLSLVYLILSSYFINIAPPIRKELIGRYESRYEKFDYLLIIDSNNTSVFTVRNNKKIIYTDICKNFHIEKLHYRTLAEYQVSFKNCKQMNSNAILKRGLFFNILIGNNGSEVKRIDPDSNVFYEKVLNR